MSSFRNPLPLVRLVSGEPTSQTRSLAVIECLVVTITSAVFFGYVASLAPDAVILRSVIFALTLVYLVRSYVSYILK